MGKSSCPGLEIGWGMKELRLQGPAGIQEEAWDQGEEKAGTETFSPSVRTN